MGTNQTPALENFVSNGVMGNIATLNPPFSLMIWIPIAIGKTADKRGILNYTEPNPIENSILMPWVRLISWIVAKSYTGKNNNNSTI